MQQILEDLKNPKLREAFAEELKLNDREDRQLEASRILDARNDSIPPRAFHERKMAVRNAVRKAIAR